MKKADHIEILRTMRDEKYREFQIRLIPSIDPGTVIGVRLFTYIDKYRRKC